MFAQGYWSQKFGQVGTNNNVPQSLAVDASGNVYIGGGFDYAFGVKTSYFAKWNQQTGWDSIPGQFYGSSFPISSMAFDANNNLYVGGGFNGVGTLAKNSIVKWNGTKWDSVPGAFSIGYGQLAKIYTAGNLLYVIGSFTKVGGVSVNGIARWNGTNWSPLGTGLVYTNSNNSASNTGITVDSKGAVYAATYSNPAFNAETISIIKWNGAQWDTVAKGLTGNLGTIHARVSDIAVNGDTIYVVGVFTTAGNKTTNCIAKWNGTSWDSLGIGTNIALTNVEVDSLGRVYAAGNWAPANGNSGWGGISRWNGKTWEKLGAGITQAQYNGPNIRDMKIVGSKLYLCGDFSKRTEIMSTGIIEWDIAASKWVPLLGKNTNGLDAAAFAYHETSKGEVYIGGEFNFAGATNARRLAKWNGHQWDSVGTGSYLNGSNVKTLVSDDTVLYIGGPFVSFNGINSYGIIKWNGQKFVSMNNTGQSGILATDVRTLTRFGSAIIVAGSFQASFGTFPNTKTVNSILKWDGTK